MHGTSRKDRVVFDVVLYMVKLNPNIELRQFCQSGKTPRYDTSLRIQPILESKEDVSGLPVVIPSYQPESANTYNE